MNAELELDESESDHDVELGHEPPALDVRLPPWRPRLRDSVREAWQSRHLLRPLAVRTVPTFHGRILGRGWIVIRPLMQVAGFGVIFGGVFNAKAPGGIPYMLFMVFSIQAFRFFDFTVLYETLSTRMVKSITRGVGAPLLLIPFAATLRGIVTLAVYWSLAAIILLYYVATRGVLYLQLNIQLLAGFLGLVLCLAFGVAIGFWTSVLYPRVQDIRYIARYVLQLWIFVTPVFYAQRAVPSTLRPLVRVNPMTPLVGMVQSGFLGAGTIHWASVGYSGAVIAVVGAGGLLFFNRHATQWIGMASFTDSSNDEEDDF